MTNVIFCRRKNIVGKDSVFKSLEGQSKYFMAYDAALRLWPASPESFDVTSEYGQTHINACGPKEGFPVVLLHGGYACSTMWFPNVGDLSKTFRVLALDTIGEPGKSLPARSNATKQDCAKWLVGVFDNLRISKAYVVGLSRGGWLALNLAIHAPQRVERIVLLSPAASFISLNAFFRVVSSAAMHFPARPVAKAAINSWVTKGFRINDVFIEQFILGLLNYNWKIATTGYSGVMPSAFSEDDLHQVHLPVLMLTGEYDRLNPPKVIERARQMIPHIETGIIPMPVTCCQWSNHIWWMSVYSHSCSELQLGDSNLSIVRLDKKLLQRRNKLFFLKEKFGMLPMWATHT